MSLASENPTALLWLPAGGVAEDTGDQMTLKTKRYFVVKSFGRRRPCKGNIGRPIVWCVRENTPAATLVATFDSERSAQKYVRIAEGEYE